MNGALVGMQAEQNQNSQIQRKEKRPLLVERSGLLILVCRLRFG
jgi:hypothetical protein